MYVLKTIADDHPMNRLSNIIKTTLYSESLRKRLFNQFVADSERNPTVVVKSLFWKSFLETLREYWHEDRFQIKNPKNMRWDLPKRQDVNFGLEAIRLIYLDQFRRVSEERVTSVFHEGLRSHPLKSYVKRSLGLGFYDLDKKKYDGPLNYEEQKKRELEDWIPIIKPSPLIENSRLIAGRNHVLNKYGLVNALEERGIRLEIIVDYKGIESQIKI